MTALGANNSNAGGGFYSQGGQFYYVRGIGLVRNTSDIGNIVVGSNNGVPIRIKDIGDVVIGHAPRLGEFGFQKNDDAVEGVILMLRGEQTQNVLKGVEAKTDELNRTILPPDVKIHPYYDRSELVKLTTDTVEDNLLRGMVLVLIVLIFFLVSFRAAIIVALTIPLSLLFAFIVLHAHDGAANLLSIGAIDFGIIIDGTVVMVENIYRELALREGQSYKLHEVILDGGERRRSAHLLLGCGDPGRLSADLCAQRTFGEVVPSHGRDHVVRAGRRADPHAHAGSGPGLLLVQEAAYASTSTAPTNG